MVILLSLGSVIAFGVSTIVWITLDQGKVMGSAFSLAHHYPEIIGFFIFSVGLGIGFNLDNGKIWKLFRVASIVSSICILLGSTFFAILQIKGILFTGVPFLVPLVIVLGLGSGYLIDRRFYQHKTSSIAR